MYLRWSIAVFVVKSGEAIRLTERVARVCAQSCEVETFVRTIFNSNGNDIAIGGVD
jgi:hypothetical protein